LIGNLVNTSTFAVLVQPNLPNSLGLDATEVIRRGRDGEGRGQDCRRDSHGDFFVSTLYVSDDNSY